MRVDSIKTIAVIGAGNMGHQIGTLCAMHGYETYVTDTSPEQLARAHAFVDGYLPGRVAKGRITQEEADKAASLIHFEPDFATAIKDADVVIEAVFEELNLKRQIFAQLDEFCKEDAIFATNASRIPSSEIAVVLRNPGRICNMHFFNPALVMKCVEVMRGPHTSDETFETICALCDRLGKVAGKLKKELFGMVGSTISLAVVDTAMAIVAGGYADIEDVDIICRGALGYPMGPFELQDLTGIDLYYRACMDRYKDTGDRNDLPWPLAVEKYAKGEWGRKTGKGHYTYAEKK